MSLLDLFNPPAPPQVKGRMVQGVTDDAADDREFYRDRARWLRMTGGGRYSAAKNGRKRMATDEDLRAYLDSGMTVAEIARRLGAHPGSVSNMLKRVRR